jgi:hypothetical protein
MPAWMDRLKTKWGITSTWQVIAILLTFSLAGMSITQIRPLVWGLFGFTPETPMWIKVPTYLVMIFPTYQVMLMVFGTLLGQFSFFWAKEKAMFRFLTGRNKKG